MGAPLWGVDLSNQYLEFTALPSVLYLQLALYHVLHVYVKRRIKLKIGGGREMLTAAEKFAILKKHGKYFVAGKESNRFVLQNIYLAPDGSAFATDASHALRIKNVHNYKEPLLLNVRGERQIESDYPYPEDGIRAVFDKIESAGHVATIACSRFSNMLRDLKKLIKVASDLCIEPSLRIRAEGGGRSLVAETRIKNEAYDVELKFTLHCCYFNQPFSAFSTCLNIRYFLHAVEIFVSAKSRGIDLFVDSEEGTVFLCDKEQDIDVAIAPCKEVG